MAEVVHTGSADRVISMHRASHTHAHTRTCHGGGQARQAQPAAQLTHPLARHQLRALQQRLRAQQDALARIAVDAALAAWVLAKRGERDQNLKTWQGFGKWAKYKQTKKDTETWALSNNLNHAHLQTLGALLIERGNGVDALLAHAQ